MRGPAERNLVRSAENTVHDLIAISNDVRRRVNHDLASRGYVDLRPSLAPLLTQLSRQGVPQARLAEAMGVSAQAASQTVGLAETAGYVAREANPEDRRSKLVVLTEHGRSFVGHGGDALAECGVHYARYVGTRRLARFSSALARLHSSFGLVPTPSGVTSLEGRGSIIAVSLLANHAMGELRKTMRTGGHDAISATQNFVLVHIGRVGARASELARAQNVSRQAVSATLHELEALGFVARRDDPDDGRGVVFTATERGLQVLALYVEGIDALEARYEAVLGVARFTRFAATAYDLRNRLRVEQSTRTLAPSGATESEELPARSAAELAELAKDLWRWLGEADAVRLTGFLGDLAVDANRLARVGDAPFTRGTA